MSFSKLNNKGRPNRPSGVSFKENVVVQISEVVLADESGKTSNPAKDYAIGYLIDHHHAPFGITPEFDDEGAPLTSVKVKITREDRLTGDKAPTLIWDLAPNRRKGSSEPIGEYPIIVAEKATFDQREGVLGAQYITVALRDYRTTKNIIDSNGYMTVRPEKDGRQTRFVFRNEEAVTFDGLADFKKKAAAFLTLDRENNPEHSWGALSVMVRLVNRDGFLREGQEVDGKVLVPDAGVAILSTRWTDETGDIDGIKAVEAWLADDGDYGGAGWIEHIDKKHGDDVVAEIIPGLRLSTGKHSIPSNSNSRSDSDDFRVPMADSANGLQPVRKANGELVVGTGYAPGIMIMTKGDRPVASATNTFKKDAFGPVYQDFEIPSPNYGDELNALMKKRAVASLQLLRAERQRANGHSAESIQTAEPDTGGGLTPS